MSNDEDNPYRPFDLDTTIPPLPKPGQGLTGFEKFCAVLAFALGVGFMLLGVLGLFTGCSANFRLPPVVGVIPAFVGWGIIRPIMKSWNG